MAHLLCASASSMKNLNDEIQNVLNLPM